MLNPGGASDRGGAVRLSIDPEDVIMFPVEP
jgi:hypothetical protein